MLPWSWNEDNANRNFTVRGYDVLGKTTSNGTKIIIKLNILLQVSKRQ